MKTLAVIALSFLVASSACWVSLVYADLEETEREIKRKERERSFFYIGFSEIRQSICHGAAKEIHEKAFMRPPRGDPSTFLDEYEKLAPAFCKWCKDIDKDHYQAVCPK